jgi:hypothetical protein
MFRRIFQHSSFLPIYSACVTAALAILVFLSVSRSARAGNETVEFDRIRVHRIDVVEPDGTPRLIIADRSEYPGSFFHGKEIDRPDRKDPAGMLFINDEGTEDGGLIYGGSTTDGKRSSFSHLSFDQYDQDQTVVLGAALSPDGTRSAGITLNDAPDQPITPELYEEAERIKAMPHSDDRKKAWKSFLKNYPSLRERASLQRADDGSVGLALRDKDGRVRLSMRVQSNGQPTIELLDANGHALRTISIGLKAK